MRLQAEKPKLKTARAAGSQRMSTIHSNRRSYDVDVKGL